jgi:xanthine/CO dehydrogenase XdhC/CoxF family maturation factor
MAERQALHAEMARESTENYIRSVSGGPSPADEIAKAKALLEAGTISESEFTALKYRALASNGASVTTAG